MSKKDNFIKIIQTEIFDNPTIYTENYPDEMWNDALTYFEALKNGSNERPLFTENGKLILQFIQKNKDTFNNLFKAKDIGEGLGISSRTASGSMRKLVTDEYLEKVGESPTIYSLTKKGEEVKII